MSFPKIGWRIVEQEQHGKQRAEYGKQIIKQASEALTAEFGKGYSETALRRFRQFFIEFNDLQIQQPLLAIFNEAFEKKQRPLLAESIQPPLVAKSGIQGSQIQPPSVAKIATGSIPMPPQLSWMHYEKLMRVPDKEARMWYMQETASQQWDYRTLKRNIDTQYYYRLMQTPAAHKPEVEKEMVEKTAIYQQEKSAFVKNPMLVEFLGLNQDTAFTESKLEETIISHLQTFLIEMGKGYAFVARQQHIHTDDDDYYIDLVFYNYLLKCFVLIDLKTTKISYQDVGQMEMYLKLYDTYKRPEGDNPSIGIILCSETNADVARFSTLASNPQMYAAKYLTYMPTQEELRREIEMQKELFEHKMQEEEE
ncbi:MAG: PDDEXK nuclease domain-containing protein [Bacteroidales bacterium]|nr:PDDEXK nuclease domain-containing protein [Bacteroidales bacterium]